MGLAEQLAKFEEGSWEILNIHEVKDRHGEGGWRASRYVSRGCSVCGGAE